MRPNWFFGFPMDGSFVLELPPLPPSFRLFHPEDVHMTLAFLGGVGEDAARRALAALAARLAESPLAPIDISLAEVVPMGSARAYSALSALLDQGREEATSYLAALRDLLTETASGRTEARAPKPHVTIARPRRRATEASRAAGLEWARALDLRAVHRTIDRVALYTWGERHPAGRLPGNQHERMFQIVAEQRLG